MAGKVFKISVSNFNKRTIYKMDNDKVIAITETSTSIGKASALYPDKLGFKVYVGFREKVWAVSEDGYFQGIYQWALQESADSYLQSFIFKMMTKRSVESTLTYDIIPNTVLSHYVKKLI